MSEKTIRDFWEKVLREWCPHCGSISGLLSLTATGGHQVCCPFLAGGDAVGKWIDKQCEAKEEP